MIQFLQLPLAQQLADFWQLHIYRNFIQDDRWRYLTDGLKNTLLISLGALTIGLLLGALVAMIRVTHDKAEHPHFGLRVLNWLCNLYLTIIRSTPVMVQLLIAYYVIFVTVDPGKLVVAILSFGFNSGAYVAEIFRGGIMSIDPGQMEAGRSLGLSYWQTMTQIILPQALKTVLPSLCNEGIALLKETSVAGYIGLAELTRGATQISTQTFDYFPPLLASAAIYLVVVLALTKLVHILERRLAQSER